MQKPGEIKKIARRTRQALFGVSGMWDDLKARWDAAIEDFQAQRVQLDQAETDLYDIYPLAQQDPADVKEWQRAFAKVNAAKSSMDAAASAVSTVTEWWNSAAGAMGLSGAPRRDGLAGALGFALPAFPVTLAGLLGLTTAASIAISGAYAVIAYINEKTGVMQQLIDNGVDPVTALKEATAAAKQNAGLPGNIERTAMWVALGAVAVFVIPKLLEARGHR